MPQIDQSVYKSSPASIFVFAIFASLALCAIILGPIGTYIGIPQYLGISEYLRVSEFLDMSLGDKIINIFYSLVGSGITILLGLALAAVIDPEAWVRVCK